MAKELAENAACDAKHPVSNRPLVRELRAEMVRYVIEGYYAARSPWP